MSKSTPVCPTDLHAPGAVEQLLAFHRAQFAGFQMQAEGQPVTAPLAATPAPTAPPVVVPTPAPPAPFQPPASQEDLNRIIQERLAREREKFAGFDDIKAKAEQFDALQEQNKTDLQKEQERAAAAEKRAIKAELKALRADVAITKGVPPNLLSGSTKEELEASAVALLAFKGEQPAPVVRALQPGNPTAPAKSVAAGQAMFAERRKPTTPKE